MSQFSAAGVTSKGAPVRLLFGWDHAVGLWADVYDPSLDQGNPFVQFYPKTPDELKWVLTKYKVKPHSAIPEGIEFWSKEERQDWENME